MKLSWELNQEERDFFEKINRETWGRPDVLWGWKRDLVKKGKQYPESRTIFFSGDFSLKQNELNLARAFFFLSTRAKTPEMDLLKKAVGKSRKLGRWEVAVEMRPEKIYPGYTRLTLIIGEPSTYDTSSVARLLKRKPRLTIEAPKIIHESPDFDLVRWTPMAVYLGSGLSAESGLPLLGEVHKIFEVDDLETGEFIFGAKDHLPERLVKDVEGEFRKFCQFNIDALKAKPSFSHQLIAKLWQKGIIRQVLTDNLDHLLQKVGVPYAQTRLSIFPDRFEVKYDSREKSLLVIGVSVDRREVIKQARRRGLKIIAINPVFEVAPRSRNMDYLQPGDIFFKSEAKEILPKLDFG